MARGGFRWLRDPLLHFAVAGTALFLLLPRESDAFPQRIAVSRADLVGYMQGRARIYDEHSFDQAYDALTPEDRAQLLDDFVRQEALYREARAIRLDEADPLVRSRLVQQMELMLRDEALAGSAVTDAEVEDYFAAHRADYAQPATASLTHVFFSSERHGAQTQALAQAELARLQAGNVAPEDAVARGDRFPYRRNYHRMAARALAPELGDAMAQAAFEVPTGTWQGPFRSPFGYHLLRVIDRTQGETPELSAIRAAVAEDALQAIRTERGEAAVQQLLARYSVDEDGDLGDIGAAAR